MTHGLAAARRVATARPWLSVVVLLALIGAGLLTYRQLRPSAAATTPTRTSTLVTVSTGTVQAAVSTTGTISPADEDDVSFASSATVTSVRVKTGERVKKGQVLGTIGTLALRSSLAQARAALADARSTLTTARDSGTSTAAQLAADKASVSTARSAVRAARTALAGAVLRSPIAGQVAEVNVQRGDTSGGSGTSNSAGTKSTTASTPTASSASTATSSGDFVVVGLKRWTASASVDDTEVGLVRKGDQAQLTTDNVTGRVFGIVSSVSVLADSSSGSASYPVEIAITGSPAGLHDGASATVSIVYKQATNVLTVSSAAIHRDATKPYVYVSKNGVKTKTTVTTGLSSGALTQIKSGLKAGDKVYLETITLPSGSTPTGSLPSGSSRQGFPTGGGFGGGGFGGGGFGGRSGGGS